MHRTMWGEINKGLLGEVSWSEALDNAAEAFNEQIQSQIQQCFECQTGENKHSCERCILKDGR